MTGEDEPPVADLAAEIMSADRPPDPATDDPSGRPLGRYLSWAFLAITVAYVIGMSVLIWTMGGSK